MMDDTFDNGNTTGADNVMAVIARITKGLTAEQQSYALLKQGRIYAEQDRYDCALEVYNKAISLHVSVNNFIARAACFEKIHSWEDAYFDYCFAIRLDPDVGIAYAHRGLCLAKLHKYDIAIEDLSRACAMEPTNANYYNRASVNLDAKRYQNALKDVNFILNNQDHPPPASLRHRTLYLKALVGIELGHYDTVITDMRELLLGNPNLGVTRSLLARAYRLKGDPRTADTQISFAIAVDPTNPDYYIERAHARTALGTFQSTTDAISDLDVAVRFLMGPIGLKSQSVRRISRQSSDLMPSLAQINSHQRSSRRFNPPQMKSQLRKASSNSFDGTGTSFSSSSLCVGAPSVPLTRSPKLESKVSSIESVDSADSDSTSRGTADRNRRPKFVRSMSKRETLSEGLDTRTMATRMKTVAAVLCQRAETRLLLLPDCHAEMTRRMHMQKSLQDSIKAVELSPAADEIKITLASCLVHLDEHSKAESVLLDVLSRHPRSVRALYRLAVCYRGQRNYGKSLDTLSQIISMTTFGPDGEITFNQTPLPDESLPQTGTKEYLRSVPVSSSGEQQPNFIDDVSNEYPLLRSRKGTLSVPTSPKQAPADISHNLFSNRPNDSEHSCGTCEQHYSELDTFGSVCSARVFELRGAIFMELQSHVLAINDFGKTISLEPDSSHCYLLRGLCHRELGRFELALQDLNACEERKFSDMCTLQTARASIFRLLKDWEATQAALESAIAFAPKGLDMTRVAYLKTQLTIAWIKLGKYRQASVEAIGAMDLIKVPVSRYINDKMRLLSKSSRRVSDIIRFAKLDNREVVSLKLEWILRYHCGLAYYKMNLTSMFIEVVSPCVSTLTDFSPDFLSVGILHFFLGVSFSALKQYKESISNFNLALSNSWSQVHDSNQVICLFGRGKAYQVQGDSAAALSNFNEALRLEPNNGHVLFRRAWLYKSALKNLDAAGADFETARRLMRGDPNFIVDYKSILHIEYVAIKSDPDLMVEFPTLSDIDKLGGLNEEVIANCSLLH